MAIKDKEDKEEKEEPSEEKQLQEALKKARKARDGVSQASANLDEALEKARESYPGKVKQAQMEAPIAKGWQAVAGQVAQAKGQQ